MLFGNTLYSARPSVGQLSWPTGQALRSPRSGAPVATRRVTRRVCGYLRLAVRSWSAIWSHSVCAPAPGRRELWRRLRDREQAGLRSLLARRLTW